MEAIVNTGESQMRSPSHLFVLNDEDLNSIDDRTITIDLSRVTTNTWNNGDPAGTIHDGFPSIGLIDGQAVIHRRISMPIGLKNATLSTGIESTLGALSHFQ